MDSSPGQLSNSSACLTDYVARHTKNANGFDHASPEVLSGGHVVDGRRAAGGPSRARRPRDVTKTSDVRRGPPCNSGRSFCRSHILPAPQRIEELLHGHDCDSVDTPRAGLKAHADMTLELPLLGKGPQRAHVPGRDGVLGLHLDPGVVAQDEVHLKPRGRSPIAEWLTGDVIPVRDELVHEIGLNPLAELGCPGAELAALERGGHASIEEVELRRGERLAP